MEIELQSLIANKMGKFLAIIMKITIYRKKIAILSRKTSDFAIEAIWIDHKNTFKEEMFADSAIFFTTSTYSNPVFSQCSAHN